VAHPASLPVAILISLAGNGAGGTGDQMPNNNIPQILIQPLKPALIAGVAQKLPVLIRVQAPDAVETEIQSIRNRQPRKAIVVIHYF
jgi:hypothetical protein